MPSGSAGHLRGTGFLLQEDCAAASLCAFQAFWAQPAHISAASSASSSEQPWGIACPNGVLASATTSSLSRLSQPPLR